MAEVASRPWGLPERQRAALVRFLSRHPHAVAWAAEYRATDPRSLVAQLVDYIRATGRFPSRTTNPERLFTECENWHAAAYHEEDPDLAPSTPLPQGPLRGLTRWGCDGARITMLEDVAAVWREGRRMEHCVSTYARRALAGTCWLFHARTRHGGATILLALNRVAGRLDIQEASGHHNRPLRPEQWEILRAWLADLNAARVARDGGEEPELVGVFE
jgi:hypothetical protein